MTAVNASAILIALIAHLLQMELIILEKSRIAENWAIDVASFIAPRASDIYLTEVFNLIIRIFRIHFGLDELNAIKVIIHHQYLSPNFYTPQCNPYIEPGITHIFVNAEAATYDQLIYQSSHEISHALMRCYPRALENKWIAEVLCEVASFFVLSEIVPAWRANKVLRAALSTKNRKPYVISLLNYSKKVTSCIPKVDSYPNYFAANVREFQVDPTCEGDEKRIRNATIALPIYEHMLVDPSGWSSICRLQEAELMQDRDNGSYIQNWHRACVSDSEKKFVQFFSELIGITL